MGEGDDAKDENSEAEGCVRITGQNKTKGESETRRRIGVLRMPEEYFPDVRAFVCSGGTQLERICI